MKQARTQGKKEERKERKKEGKKETKKERNKQTNKQTNKEKKKERKKERQAGREEKKKKKKKKGKKPKKRLPVSLGVSFPFSSFSTLLSMTLRFGFFDRRRNRIKFPSSPSVYILSATQYFRFSFRFLNCHFDVNVFHVCLINFTIFGHTFNKGVKERVLFITVNPLKITWFNLYGSGVSSPFISCSH